jgi:hypothetical protein
MSRSLLVPLDGSTLDEHALPLALRIANETGPRWVNLHRSCGSNNSLKSSRNGESLPVAAASKGQVLSVHGSVIDVAFSDEVPELHEALIVANGRRALVLEVEQLLSSKIVRTIASGQSGGVGARFGCRPNRPERSRPGGPGDAWTHV